MNVQLTLVNVHLQLLRDEKRQKRQKFCFFMQPTYNNYRLCGVIRFYHPQSISL